MSNPSKQKGTAAETAVVRLMHELGLEDARRVTLAGILDQGDIHQGRATFQVKAWAKFSDADVDQWLREVEQQRLNSKMSFGYLIVKRPGKGKAYDWHLYYSTLEFGPVCFRLGPWLTARAALYEAE